MIVLFAALTAGACPGSGGTSATGPDAGAGAAGATGAGGVAAGDGGGAGAAGASGGGAGSAGSGAGGTGGTMDPCAACSAGEGCLEVLIRRAADDSMLPWKISPAEVDGKGTLIASATSPSASRRATALADMTSPAASYILDLWCLGAGSFQVTAFLDDDGNASPTDTSSVDPLDACGQPRVVTTPILAGRRTLQDFPLSAGCN